MAAVAEIVVDSAAKYVHFGLLIGWLMIVAASRSSPNSTGFLLTDLEFSALYANDAAVSILFFPEELTRDGEFGVRAQTRIRSIFDADRFIGVSVSARFLSGRRLYGCQAFPVSGTAHRAAVGLLLQRAGNLAIDFAAIGRSFHLSPRECETVHHLVRGRTTKEIADGMGISPNTAKQFVRLIMAKMSVTTRTAIVAKIFDTQSYDVRLSRPG
jgi:DNA-binding CsgD family transcriptional regulator